MANKNLREGREVTFADGETRTIYPLTIRQLRKFMKAMKDLNTTDSANIDDADIDLMIDAASVVLEKVDKKLADDRDALEDALDIKAFNEILSAAMGTDPNV